MTRPGRAEAEAAVPFSAARPIGGGVKPPDDFLDRVAAGIAVMLAVELAHLASAFLVALLQ